MASVNVDKSLSLTRDLLSAARSRVKGDPPVFEDHFQQAARPLEAPSQSAESQPAQSRGVQSQGDQSESTPSEATTSARTADTENRSDKPRTQSPDAERPTESPADEQATALPAEIAEIVGWCGGGLTIGVQAVPTESESEASLESTAATGPANQPAKSKGAAAGPVDESTAPKLTIPPSAQQRQTPGAAGASVDIVAQAEVSKPTAEIIDLPAIDEATARNEAELPVALQNKVDVAAAENPPRVVTAKPEVPGSRVGEASAPEIAASDLPTTGSDASERTSSRSAATSAKKVTAKEKVEAIPESDSTAAPPEPAAVAPQAAVDTTAADTVDNASPMQTTPGAPAAEAGPSNLAPGNTPAAAAPVAPGGAESRATRATVAATSAERATTGQTDVERVRFAQRVSRALQTAGDGNGSLKLRLSPPELGSVRIEVTIKNGAMSARLEAETAAARATLLDSFPDLKNRLAALDIRLDRFEVDLSDRTLQGDSRESSAGNPEPQREHRAPGERGGTRGRTSERADVATRLPERIVTADQLNVVI